MPDLLEQPDVKSAKRFDSAMLEDAPEPMQIASLGEGLKMMKRSAIELNHDFATWLLELPEFDPDRPLDNGHVVQLKQAMDRGTFLPEQVLIVTCTLNNVEYRMNGQHTSWARLEMPAGYRCPVQHLRYKAETENDMRRLYASIDRMKPRTTGNVIVSYLYGTPEWEGTSKAVLRKLSEGLAFWKWEGGHARQMHDADDRAMLLMTDNYDLARKVGAFLDSSSGSSSRHVHRRPVVAAMFATFSKAAAPSIEFWSAVRDGIGFAEKQDPRLVLRNGLVSSAIGLGRGVSDEKKSVCSEEMYRWCAQSWNAWRNKQSLKILKAMLGADRPKVV